MSEEKGQSPLRRRVLPARPVRAPGFSAVEELLQVELPRGADRLLSLPVDVRSVSVAGADHGQVVAGLEEADLICPMSRGSELGLMVIDSELLAALTEIQMLGKVRTAEAKRRVPTNADLVLVSDLLDRWLHELTSAAEAGGLGDRWPVRGFTRAPGKMDGRAAELSLNPGSYRVLRVTMDLGDGARTGMLTWIVPRAGRRRPGPAAGANLGAQLRPHLLGTTVEIGVVLDRLRRPLEQVLAMRAGDLLEIAPEWLNDARLVTARGEVLARGRLGRMNGRRAVRIDAGAGRHISRGDAGPDTARQPAGDQPDTVAKAASPAEPAGAAEPAPPAGPGAPEGV